MKKIQIFCLFLAWISHSLCAQTYNRQDGGVTVVEQGENFLGDRTVDVRRYENQDDYVEGEYGTELALMCLAAAATYEAGSYVKKEWEELTDPDLRAEKKRLEVQQQFKKILEEDKMENLIELKAPMYPLVESVDPDDLGWFMDIREGDFIISYGGHDLGWADRKNNPLAFKIKKFRASEVDVVTVVYQREKKRYTSTVKSGVPLGLKLSAGFPVDVAEKVLGKSHPTALSKPDSYYLESARQLERPPQKLDRE